ncbi:MAG: UDP-N-acetylmuramoyl-L-alanine--D-glutamate ligase [Anaerolineaceae bacterium]
MRDYRGMNVLVLGGARQGIALARFLSEHKALVTLNDNRPADAFLDIIHDFAGLHIQTHFGSHPLSLLEGCDLLCISGGVPLDLPIVQEAVKRGIPLSNDSQIFFEGLKAMAIGITGSAGKTTTTTMVGEIAKKACRKDQKAWIGGNIGTPLIPFLKEIRSEDIVVLELSSFQLELMTISPAIAAITNITPNHLDRHGSMQAYTAAKAHILAYQKSTDAAILNREDPGAWNLRSMVQGKLISFGLKEMNKDLPGTFLRGNSLWIKNGDLEQEICSTDSIHLRGEHNVINALAACAIAGAAGFSVEAMQTGIEEVRGIPHRLEFVRRWHNADWYNDSIATTPERTLAAIRSFHEPLVLLLGGRDKHLPWMDLAAQVHSRVEHIILFGEAADLIYGALDSYEQHHFPYTLEKASTLSEAVQIAARTVQEGDVVLLSPGGTSYDAFKDFEERGILFKKIVEALE